MLITSTSILQFSSSYSSQNLTLMGLECFLVSLRWYFGILRHTLGQVELGSFRAVVSRIAWCIRVNVHQTITYTRRVPSLEWHTVIQGFNGFLPRSLCDTGAINIIQWLNYESEYHIDRYRGQTDKEAMSKLFTARCMKLTSASLSLLSISDVSLITNHLRGTTYHWSLSMLRFREDLTVSLKRQALPKLSGELHGLVTSAFLLKSYIAATPLP